MSVIISIMFCFVKSDVVVISTNETYSDRIASFGPRIGDPVFGILVPLISLNASNHDGCAISEKPNVEQWIAIVQRGNCNFSTKVRMMQSMGAIAVIVGDNVYSNKLISMYAGEDTKDILIPSVFVTRKTYEILISKGDPIEGKYHLETKITKSLFIQWPMMDIVIIIIIAPAVVIILLYSFWRFRQHRQFASELAPKSIVLTLPIKKYHPKSDQSEADTCPICLEDYLEGVEVRILPCHHEYHVNCIDEWLTTRKRYCPLCKKDACPPGSSERSPLIIQNSYSNSHVQNSQDSQDDAQTVDQGTNEPMTEVIVNENNKSTTSTTNNS